MKTRKKYRKRQIIPKIIETGIKQIDDAYRIQCPSLTLIMGSLGNGKTTLLENIASRTGMTGKKVIYISLAERMSFVQDYDCVYAFSFPISTSIDEIIACVDGIKAKDMIVIDGIQLMSNSKPLSMDSYTYMGYLASFRKLITYCCRKNIALIGSLQVKQEVDEAECISSSSRIMAFADLVWKVELLNSELIIKCLKSRAEKHSDISLSYNSKTRRIN